MIHYRSVWARDKQIGRVYNHEMSLLPNDYDYCCFLDGDAVWTTKYYGNQIEDIIAQYPKVGMFTCMTNRVNNPNQLYMGRPSKQNDMRVHRKIGTALYNQFKHKVTTCKGLVSGVVMAVRKEVWNHVKFPELEGLAGVDNQYHKDLLAAGYEVVIMQGVYVFHWYDPDRSHLK